MMAAEFKVSVESLHTTKVKEINYDGEEIYEEKPSLSKRLSYLAQRVNFEEGDEREENTTPAAKKSTRKRPWEFTHSKLKQALTEVSVLSDVLNIIQSNRQYISLDRIYSERATLPPLYQYNIKKKALEVAAGILKRGAEPFKRSRSHGDYEFHKTLHDLRKRWILRRTLSNVCGDLSYHSAGSLYTQSVQFEVHKGTEGSGNILSVVVPQELRGQSEIIIFLADKPVRKVGMINSLLPACFVELRKRRMLLTSWEQKLVSAQNVLFNEELFAQLTKEAFEQRSNLQGEVLTDRINIPVMN
jgi:mediator of RNA polymerase II transcription subunit 17